MIENFDFSNSAEAVRACFRLPTNEINKHLTQALFNAPELPLFLADYLSKAIDDKFQDDLVNHDNDLPGNGLGNNQATGISLGWIYTDYRDEVIPRDGELVRDKTTYPLTIDEVHTARNFMSENIEMHIAILVIKDAVHQYLNAWERYLLTGVDMNIYHSVIERMQDLKTASGGFTFPHDLSPQFALGFGQTGKKFSDIDKEDFRNALVQIFRKQAMKSKDKDGVTTCPFSSSFAKVFSFKPVLQADGSVQVEQGEFGDLLKFIGQKVMREVDPQTRDDYVHFFAV